MDRKEKQRARKEQAHAKAAARIDAKHVKKALRRSPNAPVIVTRAIGRFEVGLLLETGWEIIDSRRSQWAGSDLWSETMLQKPNPNLVSYAGSSA